MVRCRLESAGKAVESAVRLSQKYSALHEICCTTTDYEFIVRRSGLGQVARRTKNPDPKEPIMNGIERIPGTAILDELVRRKGLAGAVREFNKFARAHPVSDIDELLRRVTH